MDIMLLKPSKITLNNHKHVNRGYSKGIKDSVNLISNVMSFVKIFITYLSFTKSRLTNTMFLLF